MKRNPVERNLLIMAGFCRYIWMLREKKSQSPFLHMRHLDVVLLSQLLRGGKLEDVETSGLLSVVHEAILLGRPLNNEEIDWAELQTPFTEAPWDTRPFLQELPSLKEPLTVITTRDSCALPGQVYTLWAGEVLTCNHLPGCLGRWVVLRPPECNFGVVGFVIAAVPFWLRSRNEINSRWVITLGNRVEIVKEQPKQRKAWIRLAPLILDKGTAANPVREACSLGPDVIPPPALRRLLQLNRKNPTLAACTAANWLSLPGNTADFDQAIDLLSSTETTLMVSSQ